LVGVGGVEVQTLGLAIRSVRPADVRALVPVELEPAQIFEDARLRLTRRPLCVGILDAEDERAVLAVSKQPVEQRRAPVADVKLPRWTRGKSNPHRVSLNKATACAAMAS